MKNAILFFAVMGIFSCHAISLVQVSDPDVSVWANGVYRGKGEVALSDYDTEIELKKRGCQTEKKILERDYLKTTYQVTLIGKAFMPLPLVLPSLRPLYSFDFFCVSDVQGQ